MIPAIYNRRSIRRFSPEPLDDTLIWEILESATKAPSSKNRQPWKFIIVQGDSKESLLKAFRKGIAREERGDAILPGCHMYVTGAKHTVTIMEQAPVIVLVVNPLGSNIFTN